MSMERVFVDSSAWIALFNKSDKFYKQAVLSYHLLKKAHQSLYTSDYVIDETITTIFKKTNHAWAVWAGEILFKSKIITIIYISSDYLPLTWELFKKYSDKNFSFTDVSCLAVMKNLNIKKAFSFDQEFRKAGVELIE